MIIRNWAVQRWALYVDQTVKKAFSGSKIMKDAKKVPCSHYSQLEKRVKGCVIVINLSQAIFCKANPYFAASKYFM